MALPKLRSSASCPRQAARLNASSLGKSIPDHGYFSRGTPDAVFSRAQQSKIKLVGKAVLNLPPKLLKIR
jgi:hypothetical protein